MPAPHCLTRSHGIVLRRFVQFRKSLYEGKKLISYIHVADSNRLAPGWGHLPFEEVFAALNEIGYDGWITAEVLPRPDPEKAAEQAVRFLRPLISRNTFPVPAKYRSGQLLTKGGIALRAAKARDTCPDGDSKEYLSG